MRGKGGGFFLRRRRYLEQRRKHQITKNNSQVNSKFEFFKIPNHGSRRALVQKKTIRNKNSENKVSPVPYRRSGKRDSCRRRKIILSGCFSCPSGRLPCPSGRRGHVILKLFQNIRFILNNGSD
jgi:hypothetical protein